MITQDESPQRVKAIISTVVFHVLVLLGCYFFYFTAQIPQEDIELGGIMINYGTSETGMGNDMTSMDEPSMAQNIGKEPIEDPNRPNSTPVQSSVSAERDVLTQDNEDAPVVNDKKPTTSNNSTTNTPVENKPVQPVVDQRGLFKGNKNNATGGGDGTGNTPGNQGGRDGDPNSKSYVGNGGSGGGDGFALVGGISGRKFISLPRIQDDGQTVGRIVVDISVDKSGKIITAKAGGRGTTITNASMWDKCERAVLNVKLNDIQTGPEIQTGSIVFTFEVK